MKKLVYSINANGYIIETYVADVDSAGNILDEDMNDFIVKAIPHGLFKPKWTGAEWIEGATQEEIDELTKVEPSPPTEVELLKAELSNTNAMLLDMMELLLGGI